MAELRFAYAARGYDYAGAIERVAGDEELLHSLLDMFAADESFLKLMSALDAHDERFACSFPLDLCCLRQQLR